MVLAFELFRPDVRIGDLLAQAFHVRGAWGYHFRVQIQRNGCWLLYGPAQMLIVYASSQIISAYESLPPESSKEPHSVSEQQASAKERISTVEEPVT